MDIGTFLYSLCIAPLESGMRLILEAAYALTGSWGMAVLLMSLAVNSALIPLYHLAEGWQEDERDMQKRMAARRADIKAVYRGRERYMFLRALYRIHGYTPLLAVRSAMGLLIQIPFFFAAFHLLNNAPELSGQSFWFLADLARPDGLLPVAGAAINVLPFVMTGVNLVSAAVYAARLGKREKIQLVILAAVFLVLLYTSSSALLLYWTCNNLFSFFKNLYYRDFIYADTRKGVSPVAALSARILSRPARRPAFAPRHADLFLSLLSLGLLLSVKATAKGSALCFALMGLCLACAGTALWLRREKKLLPENDPGYALWVIAGMLAFAVYGLSSPDKLSPALLRLYSLGLGLCVGAVFLCLFTWQPIFCLTSKAAGRCVVPLARGGAARLYGAAVLLGAALLFLHTPALLYLSDPDFFSESLAGLGGGILFLALSYIAFWLLLFRRANEPARALLALVLAWLSVAMLLYVFVAPGDYGALDGFVFQDTRPLRSKLGPLVDAAVLGGALVLVGLFLVRARAAALSGLMRAFALILVILPLWQLALLPSRAAPAAGQASGHLPSYAERLFSFSRDKENTLIIMPDMFTGGHAGELFREDPALAAQFEGFTWYPDMVSPGGSTLLSLSGMLGGEGFTPDNINRRKQGTLPEAINEAYAVLPNIFVPQGRDVALADLEKLDPDLFARFCPFASQTLVLGRSIHSDFTGYWRETKGLPPSAPEKLSLFLASAGLFRASPWVMRRHIYNDGLWLSSNRYNRNLAEGSIALLDVLPKVSGAGNPKATLKYMTSMLSHFPWSVDPETCMPADIETMTRREDGVIIEHLNAERCALRALGRWFQWMRDNGVYDNTQIIIISDHGYYDSAQLPTGTVRAPRKMPWRPHALLLVKERNARGALQTDMRPMAGVDLLPIICRENGPCPEAGRADPFAQGHRPRVRANVAGYSGLDRHEERRFILQRYTVTGSMFDPDNWKAVDD